MVLALSACDDNSTLLTDVQARELEAAKQTEMRLQRLERQQARVTQMMAEAQACDKNEGIRDFETDGCYRDTCTAKLIHCNDGMSKVFKGNFRRQYN